MSESRHGAGRAAETDRTIEQQSANWHPATPKPLTDVVGEQPQAAASVEQAPPSAVSGAGGGASERTDRAAGAATPVSDRAGVPGRPTDADHAANWHPPAPKPVVGDQAADWDPSKPKPAEDAANWHPPVPEPAPEPAPGEDGAQGDSVDGGVVST